VYITHDQSEALVLSDRLAVMNAGRFEQVGTPEEIYHRPASAFVAGFVGEANRLPGTVSAVRADAAQVLLDGGLQLPVRCTAPLADGAAVEVFLRPEAIRVIGTGEAEPGAGPMLAATVQAALFDGARSTLLVQADGVGMALRVAWPASTQASHARGSRLRLAIAADAAWAFAR